MDVWVDLEDIPPSADWFERLKTGIEEAKSFLFVISPESVGSDVCAREVAHAAGLNKRVIPLLRRDVDTRELPAAISRHNWIECREGNDFEAAVTTLVEAVRTDLEWVDAHTRWQNAAMRWDREERDSSLLLRGTELASAEAWLTRAGSEDKQPPPTALHYEYILAGRKQASRRQRIVVGAVSAALLVTLGLAVFALVLRGQANAERRAAVSRELSANAFLTLPEDPQLSLLLARRAARVDENTQAEDALRQSLVESRIRLVTHRHGEDLSAARMSPDGRTILTTSDDNTARVSDAGSGRALHVLRGHVQPIADGQFSPDGRLALTFAQDATVRVWDTTSGRSVQVLRQMDEHRLTGALFDPSGTRIVTSSFVHGPVRIWSVETGDVLQTFSDATKTSTRAVFDPSGQLVATAGQDGAVRLFEASTGEQLWARRADSEYVWDVAFHPRAGYLVTVGEDGFARSWSVDDGQSLAFLPGHGEPAREVVFSPRGGVAAIGAEDGSVRLWPSTGDRSTIELTGHSRAINEIDFSPGGDLVATASEDGTARIWRSDTGSSFAVLRGHRGPVTSVEFGRGDTVLTGSADGTARAWSAAPAAGAFPVVRSIRASDVGAADMSDNGRFLLASDFDFEADEHTTSVLEMPSGRRKAAVSAAGVAKAVSNDGSLVVESPAAEGQVKVRNVETGRVMARLDLAGFLESAAFSPRGDRVAVGSSKGVAMVVELPGGRRVSRMRGHRPAARGGSGSIYSVRFSPDGSRIATLGEDATLRLWETESGRPIRTLRGFPPLDVRMVTGGNVVFSPDGELIAAHVPWSDTALLWQADTGRRGADLEGHSDAVNSIRFSGDGDLLVTTGFDNSTRIWDLNGRLLASLQTDEVKAAAFPGEARTIAVLDFTHLTLRRCLICGGIDTLLEAADRRVTRGFTDAERARYLQSDD
jgi:WD40 repeat protein